jgi:serine/threonine protein kinase
VRSIAKQLISLVDHIHCEGYVHRDIKVDNFVYLPAENQVLLAICDTVCKMSDSLVRPIGSMHSCAPESRSLALACVCVCV